ncbi:MAG TPA: efflux RND transporter periplasmic adaptor subunit [Gemmatimonadaceae bacterium]|nr:efflux RND transporter periplasmic adaptor subunit [Gemmatimonadaceae bacterium]
MKRVLITVALLAPAACKSGAPPEAGKPQAEVAASVAVVQAQHFTETVDAVGVVVPRIGHVAALAAPAPTRVAKVYVTAGAHVNQGDPLVEFEQAPFEATLRSTEAALATAQRAAERAQRLADAGVSARREAEVAASDLAVAQANFAAAKLARDRATLRAPISGVVTRMSAVLGANADASQSLVEVADPSALDAALTLSPNDAARVRAGHRVTLYAGAAATGEPVASGRVSDVSAAVDTASRGIMVRAEVASGASALRLGGTVFGRIAIADHPDAVVVPAESLVPTGEGFKVFVVDDNGIAMSRPVKLGGRSDKGAWVTDGLKAGEKVVTAGAYGVDDSTKVAGAAPDRSKKDAGVKKP